VGIALVHLGQARATAHGRNQRRPQRLQSLWLDRILFGRFFYQASASKFTSETYQAFLRTVLRQARGPLFLACAQDGAKYHTSKATRAFLAAQPAHLTVSQMPSYSPDYNPIEYLWRKIKREATHDRYFAAFEHLVYSVDQTLAALTQRAAEVLNLFGRYCTEVGLEQLAPTK